VSGTTDEVEVSAVMPCLNEEETLGICVKKALQCFSELGVKGEVVIGDNGSTDRSIEIAESLGARIAPQPIRGYGAALQAGIEAARGRYCIMADCDDSYDWSNMGPFIEKLREGYDLVMGTRLKGTIMPGAMPPLHRYFGNPVLSGIMNVFFATGVSDAHCGMRGFSKAAYQRMNLGATGMEFATEMVVKASNRGLRITEIPITLYPDGRSRAPHLRSFRDGWRHLRFMLFHAPDYLYIIPGALLMGIGLVLQLLLLRAPTTVFGVHLGIHWLALGCLLSLLGFQIVSLGAFAKAFGMNKSFEMSGWIFQSILKWFSLEVGLVVGAAMVILGFAADFAILVVWFSRGMGELHSVHTVFVATTTIALGVQIMFCSFFLSLFLLDADQKAIEAKSLRLEREVKS
jgi:glycosyltransferase involved in cell wall biosynthesis